MGIMDAIKKIAARREENHLDAQGQLKALIDRAARGEEDPDDTPEAIEAILSAAGLPLADLEMHVEFRKEELRLEAAAAPERELDAAHAKERQKLWALQQEMKEDLERYKAKWLERIAVQQTAHDQAQGRWSTASIALQQLENHRRTGPVRPAPAQPIPIGPSTPAAPSPRIGPSGIWSSDPEEMKRIEERDNPKPSPALTPLGLTPIARVTKFFSRG